MYKHLIVCILTLLFFSCGIDRRHEIRIKLIKNEFEESLKLYENEIDKFHLSELENFCFCCDQTEMATFILNGFFVFDSISKHSLTEIDRLYPRSSRLSENQVSEFYNLLKLAFEANEKALANCKSVSESVIPCFRFPKEKLNDFLKTVQFDESKERFQKKFKGLSLIEQQTLIAKWRARVYSLKANYNSFLAYGAGCKCLRSCDYVAIVPEKTIIKSGDVNKGSIRIAKKYFNKDLKVYFENDSVYGNWGLQKYKIKTKETGVKTLTIKGQFENPKSYEIQKFVQKISYVVIPQK